MPDDAVRSAPSPISDPSADVHDPGEPESGTALCLSGGGYRAMLFHVGGIIRLNELGLLRSVDRVSSVSGGSITAATLAMAWTKLRFGADGVADNLDAELVVPLRKMAETSIDKKSILTGILTPGRTVADLVAAAYDKHLFHGATLRDLPPRPRFVINATNVQTGKLFRFSRPYAGDYTVGLWRDPVTPLRDAVAASSAFPPVLSPHTITPSGTFDTNTIGSNADEQFRSRWWLSDGGVYDNLGLETAWKQCHTVFVSDGGGQLGAEVTPKRNWAEHAIRVAEIADSQVRAMRKRSLIDGYQERQRAGSYWGIRSQVADFHLADPVLIPADQTDRARSVKTGLSRLDADTQRALINWGYAIADTAIRRWVQPTAPKPSQLPVK